MSGIQGFPPGSVVKSVQRGVTSVGSQTTVNVTLTAVNTAKAIVNFPTNVTGGNGQVSYANLTSSTNLALYNGTASTLSMSWEVLEFN